MKSIVFLLCLLPVIGVALVERGEFALSVGVEGEDIGALLPSVISASVFFLAFAVVCRRGDLQFSSVTAINFRFSQKYRLACNICAAFVFVVVILVLFYFFNAVSVLSGGERGEYRAVFGGFGYYLITKLIVPLLFVYVSVVTFYGKRRILTYSIEFFPYILNISLVFFIGLLSGFKSTFIMYFVPVFVLLYWNIGFFSLIFFFSGALVLMGLVSFVYVGQINVDILTALITRVTIIMGDVGWYIWKLVSIENIKFDSSYAFYSLFGNTIGTLFVGSNYSIVDFDMERKINIFVGLPSSAYDSGHNVQAGIFGWGMVYLGPYFFWVYSLIFGLFIGIMSRVLCDLAENIKPVALSITAYYIGFIGLSALMGGGVSSFLHVSVLIYLVIGFLFLLTFKEVSNFMTRLRW